MVNLKSLPLSISVGRSSMSGFINADLIMLKIDGLITKRLIGFSGVESSSSGELTTKPWKM